MTLLLAALAAFAVGVWLHWGEESSEDLGGGIEKAPVRPGDDP
jgi:hypothetical protein